MDAYEQIRIIGKGSFGVVTQIVRKADRKVRAEATRGGQGGGQRAYVRARERERHLTLTRPHALVSGSWGLNGLTCLSRLCVCVYLLVDGVYPSVVRDWVERRCSCGKRSTTEP